jgi:putative flippase GtrA
MKTKFAIFKENLIKTFANSNLPILSHPKVLSALDHLLTINFIRYLIVGFTTFGLDFGIFHILDTYSSIHDLPANMTSTLLSLGFNFYMSNFWTFKAGGKEKLSKLKRYASLAVFNYTFTNVFFFIVSVQLNVNAMLTKVLATGMIVSWNYFIYKLWIFKKE